jgi:hypothetical protein
VAEVLNKNFVTTLCASGLSEMAVIRHVPKNEAPPGNGISVRIPDWRLAPHGAVFERHRARRAEAARRRSSASAKLGEHPFGTQKLPAGCRQFRVRGSDTVRRAGP